MNNTHILLSSHNKSNITCWLVAILLYLSLFPYFIWKIVPLSNWLISIPLFLLFLSRSNIANGFGYFVSFAFIAIWGAICGGNNIIGIAMITISSIIFIVDRTFLVRVYYRYRLIFVILLSCSLIVYLLISFGINLPYHISPPPPRNTIDYNYYIYPFYASPSVDDWRNLGLNRFNALFDEPGVVGTISFIILFIEKFNLKKIGNIVLLVSGILSFSLFFYIAVVLYFLYHVIWGRTKFINKLVSGLIIILCLVQFTKTSLFEGYIGDRLIWEAEAKTISGDDRSSDDLKGYINDIRGSYKYYFGNPDAISRYQDSASLEKQILAHGAITIALFFLFFAIYSYHYLKFSQELILFLIIFFSIMYNRPTMFALDRLYLYCMMIFAWTRNSQDTFKQLNIATQSKYWLIRNY